MRMEVIMRMESNEDRPINRVLMDDLISGLLSTITDMRLPENDVKYVLCNMGNRIIFRTNRAQVFSSLSAV